MYEVRPRWSPGTKLTITLLLLSLGVYLLYRFRSAIKPLILAFILAYILTPLTNWLENRLHLRRSFATLLSYLVFIVFLMTIPVVFIPPLAAQFSGLNLDFQLLLRQVRSFLGGQVVVMGQTLNIGQIFDQAVGSVQRLIEPIFTQTLSFAIEAISSLVWVIFIFIVSFYLVKDKQALRDWIENITPPAYRKDFFHLREEINEIWGAFFRGQLVLAFVVTIIFALVGLIIGLPFALVMAVFAGLMEFLPSLGHGIWLMIASLLAFFVGSTWLPIPNWAFMLLVIGLHLFFEQFDLNYLIPRIVGRRVHLPPLVVILGIVTGALLAGMLGILLAAPTIASARVVGRYLYANLFDQEVLPSTVAPPLPPPNPRWWRKAPQKSDVDRNSKSGNL